MIAHCLSLQVGDDTPKDFAFFRWSQADRKNITAALHNAQGLPLNLGIIDLSLCRQAGKSSLSPPGATLQVNQ